MASALSAGEQAALEKETAAQRGEPSNETEAAEQQTGACRVFVEYPLQSSQTPLTDLSHLLIITGTNPIPRTLNEDLTSPTSLDPRFDRDDLRQGKPPPAARNHQHLAAVGKLPGQALKLPGHALRVPGKGLKKVRKIVVGKDGKEKEVEEEVEVDEADADAEGQEGVVGQGEKEQKDAHNNGGGGFLNKVFHPHGHGHKS